MINLYAVEMTRLNVPKSRQNTKLPQTPDIPPAHPRLRATTQLQINDPQPDRPTSAPVAQDATNDQQPDRPTLAPTAQDAKILQVAKRELHRMMFTWLAVPQKMSQREEIIDIAVDTAMSTLNVPVHHKCTRSLRDH